MNKRASEIIVFRCMKQQIVRLVIRYQIKTIIFVYLTFKPRIYAS